jgi:CBF1 interacting corepressor
MYAPPPGLAAPEHAASNNKSEPGISNSNINSASNNNNNNIKTNNLTVERQPGDDDAAAAFRQMLAAAATDTRVQRQGRDEAGCEEILKTNVSSSGAALSGTTVEKAMPTDKELTALEKAVGRRDASSAAGLSLEEQIARFPQLKNAPMAKGMNATNVGVTFKPLGTQLRNVRCMVCGIWGHSRGDRECLKSGWDPFLSNPRPTPTAVAVVATPTGILPDSKSWTQQDGSTRAQSIDAKEDTKRRARDDSSESSSDSEDSYRRRKRRRKDSKSHHKKSKRKRRDEDERKSSHKRRKKHSRHD